MLWTWSFNKNLQLSLVVFWMEKSTKSYPLWWTYQVPGHLLRFFLLSVISFHPLSPIFQISKPRFRARNWLTQALMAYLVDPVLPFGKWHEHQYWIKARKRWVGCVLSVITLYYDTEIIFIYLQWWTLMLIRESGKPRIITLDRKAIPLLRNLQG